MPATFLQQRQFLSTFDATSVANVHFAWRLRGPLDVVALHSAVASLVARHESLRTELRIRSAEVKQHILPSSALRAEPFDASEAWPRRPRVVKRFLRRHAREPFDLTVAPLARVAIIRLGPLDHLLVWTLHHSICDGWSLRVLLDDFRSAYVAAVSDRPLMLPDLRIQMGDYAAWERSFVDDDAGAYWRARMSKPPIPLVLPDRDADAGVGHFETAEPLARVSPPVVRALSEVSRLERATLSMTLTAAFAAVVAPHAGGPSVALGITDANRDRAELRAVVGCCLDLIPIYLDITGDPSLATLVERVRDEVRSAYTHRVPVGRLANGVWPLAPAWFDVLVNFMPSDPANATHTTEPHALTVMPAFGASHRGYVARYNWSGWRALGPVLQQHDDGALTGTLLHNSRVVSRGLARQLAGRFYRILRAAASRPNDRMSRLIRDETREI